MSFDDRESIQQHILDHYEDPYHRGPLQEATHASEGDIPICGDVIRIELRITPDGVIQQAWFDGQGCVASQAAASMLVESIEGKSIQQLRAFSAQEMLALVGPPMPPNRQKCCLLGWRVLQSALATPIDKDLEDAGPRFGGPSLSEES